MSAERNAMIQTICQFRRPIWPRSIMVLGSLFGLVGCHDLSGTQPLPAGTVSPGIVQTPAGAAATAIAAQAQFQVALASYIPISGELTDELTANARGPSLINGFNSSLIHGDVVVDARQLDQSADWSAYSGTKSQAVPATDSVYIALQQFRGLARQAIGGLAAYAPSTSANQRGALYALLGYAEVFLADLFCSGVPLSTLDFQGDYTYQPSSTTAQVYQHAIALFDTASTLAADSAPIVALAQVGKGRAYLALGEYSAAGQAVQNVPLTFQYIDSLLTCGSSGNPCPTFASGATTEALFAMPQAQSVSNHEGGTGLPYISSGDPRTASTLIGTTPAPYGYAEYFPAKYNRTGISEILLASGIEAQLITAEAQLNAGNATGAFTILNALRTQNPATASLPPLTDPGTFGSEIDTLFTERAAWLFADGHRQGDLRRLIRQYEHGQQTPIVTNQYPSGTYPGLGLYENYIDASIPATELANRLFTGCLSRD